MTAPRYRLEEPGYANASFRWITCDRKRVGRVMKNADDSFTGIVGRVQAQGSSWEDAKNRVVAEVEGISVSELTNELVQVRPVQERTQAILAWLANHAEDNDGRLNFTNTDLARAAGWPRPNQALGNLVSRLDLCCARPDCRRSAAPLRTRSKTPGSDPAKTASSTTGIFRSS